MYTFTVYRCHSTKFLINFWQLFDIFLKTFWWLPFKLANQNFGKYTSSCTWDDRVRFPLYSPYSTSHDDQSNTNHIYNIQTVPYDIFSTQFFSSNQSAHTVKHSLSHAAKLFLDTLLFFLIIFILFRKNHFYKNIEAEIGEVLSRICWE